MTRQVILSIESYRYLADEVAQLTGWKHYHHEVKSFPNGSVARALDRAQIINNDVIIIAGTVVPENLQEIQQLVGASHKLGARSHTVVIPYYGTQRLERRIKRGDVVAAKADAVALSSMPQAPFGNRFLLFDLHAETIESFFEGSVRAEAIQCGDITAKAIKKLGGDHFKLYSADYGGLKWTAALGKVLGVEAKVCLKERTETGSRLIALEGNLDGWDVVIFDDIADTARSLDHAAAAIKASGARRVFAVISHLQLTGDALPYLKAQGNISKMIGLNTHPNAVKLADGDFLTTESIAPLIVSEVKGGLGLE